MKLIIENGTHDGEIKKETIRWAEEQFNIVLTKIFNRYRLLNHLAIRFNIPENVAEQESIQIGVVEGEPKNGEQFNSAIKEVKQDFFDRKIIEAKQDLQVAMMGEIVEPKKKKK